MMLKNLTYIFLRQIRLHWQIDNALCYCARILRPAWAALPVVTPLYTSQYELFVALKKSKVHAN